MSERIDRAWWKESVIYQIYPRSFNDSDGDGVGDVLGIIERLDYLDALGVDIVWLNPVYESPNVDNGYDIADYRSVMAEFGTMSDLEALIEGLHDRDMKLIMDLVVNHTSDEHEWFERSRESTSSRYRDYYHWREGRPADEVDYDTVRGPEGEAPPNNWRSFFGGPAWTYDERTGEWYLHLFDEKQPDLNWENPDVRESIYDVMEWWLDKGVSGFRMDVVNLLSKAPGLPDGYEDDVVVRGAEHFVNGPRIHEFVGEMFDRVLAGTNTMTVGEMVEVDVEEALRYIGEEGDGMSMLFNFDHMRLDFGPEGRWSHGNWQVHELRRVLTHWQYGLSGDGWNSLYLNNHDQPRMVSRFGDDAMYREESAKLLATLLHTLQGTPYIYQGEEIGMTNYPFETLGEVRDVDTIKNVRAAQRRGIFESEEEALEVVRYRSRDNARTPMQWTDGENTGFTEGDPWMPVNPNHRFINVEKQMEDPDSIWHYYRRLLELRGEYDVLIYGAYDLVATEHDRVWAYSRQLGDELLLVVLNFGPGNPTFEPPKWLSGAPAEVLISNYETDEAERITSFSPRPWEARVYHLRD